MSSIKILVCLSCKTSKPLVKSATNRNDTHNFGGIGENGDKNELRSILSE